MSELVVYAPREGALPQIIRGSGIVGSPARLDPGRVVIDFEGNRYGAANLVTYADRVRQAAGRHRERYPTSARAAVRLDALVPIGVFDGFAVWLDDEDCHDLLARWLELESVPMRELVVTS